MLKQYNLKSFLGEIDGHYYSTAAMGKLGPLAYTLPYYNKQVRGWLLYSLVLQWICFGRNSSKSICKAGYAGPRTR